MNRLPGIGLRGEITLNLFLFVAMMIVMMAFLLFDVSREGVVVQRIEDRRGMIESIREDIERRISEGGDLAGLTEQETFRKVLQGYRDGGLFRDARIYDTSGRTLLWVGESDVPVESRTEDAQKAMQGRRLITRINRDDTGLLRNAWGEVILSAPVHGGDGVVGGIQLVSAITDVRDGIAHYNWNVLILLVVFSLLMVVVISYSLGHEIVQPIEEIVEATQRVREGDLEQRLPVKSGNEIGRLARSFNEMVRELREKNLKIGRYLDSLKRVNRKLKRAEHRAIRSEKLVTIGRLAAGVAHEVGNPLGALYGYLELLRKKVENEEGRELIEKVEKETNRINEIIFGLLDLSRQGERNPRTLRINELIEKTIALLSAQNALSGVESRLHLKLDLPEVLGDPRDFQQALINVIINAVESMPSGGLLTIRPGTDVYRARVATRVEEPVRREDDPHDLDYSVLRRRRHGSATAIREGEEVVRVEIADTGKGIKREHLDRIFDPFFTLKEKGKGTGLGLSISERIIRGMGGLIEVDSVWGRGTTVTFLLTREERRTDPARDRTGTRESIDRRSET
jgi:signal transduction histidine kinase